MRSLTDITRYDESLSAFSKENLWAMFDGDKSQLNIGHECLDRHPANRVAVNIIHGDAPSDELDESLTYGELTTWSNRFANYLISLKLPQGSRVAIMLEPSLIFYASLFGAMKANCIAVPLFTLFGPEGIRLRLDDCQPRLLLASADALAGLNAPDECKLDVADDHFLRGLASFADEFTAATSADDMAMYQYTSGTTRQLPDAIKHRHRAIVTVMIAALYGTGVRPGDKFCCPSSPAWGHGLWHGTLAPLALGATITSYRGRFAPERLLDGIEKYQINNLSAAATHYRMMRTAAKKKTIKHQLMKLSFTGEPIDSETERWVNDTFGRPVHSMYGTTEVGVILVSYPTAEDFACKPGSLGKAVPGVEVAIIDNQGKPCAAGQRGEIMVNRKDGWFPTKDLGYFDEDGYFFHAGRADDVIISAGWTMSAVEIENVISKHQDVREVAVIASPDKSRGHIPKAFVVSTRNGSSDFEKEIIKLAKSQLSQHEYPRAIEFVEALPKLPAGKINRKALREAEQQRAPKELT